MLAWAAEWYAWLVKKEPGFTRFRVNYATSQRYFNIKKARMLLGYQTLYSLHDGLEKSVKVSYPPIPPIPGSRFGPKLMGPPLG